MSSRRMLLMGGGSPRVLPQCSRRYLPTLRGAVMNNSSGTDSYASLLSWCRRPTWGRCKTLARTATTTTTTTTMTTETTTKTSRLHDYDLNHDECNVTTRIAEKVGRNLHLQPNHPLNRIKTVIEDYWKARAGAAFSSPPLTICDDLDPVVSTHANFDALCIPPNHVSRSKSDTYYLRNKVVLRTHTSAHQVELLRQHDFFLVTGDVYRRDEIDACHYPVFHQMEGVKLFDSTQLEALSNKDVTQFLLDDLKSGLEGMVQELFGNVEMRWISANFPFTHPSLELEIYFRNEWLEVLGCGIIHPKVLQAAQRLPTRNPGWAFGLGLERLAMVLFGIPDIRLFWTTDERFHSQFSSSSCCAKTNIKFQPYSKYPPCLKDVSFWTGPDFHANDFFEVVRQVAGDWVERVDLMDEYTHPKTGRQSKCFRISYRSMDKSLRNEEVDALQEVVRQQVSTLLGVELR